MYELIEFIFEFIGNLLSIFVDIAKVLFEIIWQIICIPFQIIYHYLFWIIFVGGLGWAIYYYFLR